MLYEMTIPLFTKALHNMSKHLEKGAAYADTKKFEVDVLLNSRLAPDQFHLIRQVQVACDTAKFAASRLTNKEAPTHEDKEKTLAELQTRIDSTLSYLKTFNPAEFKGAEERKVSHPRWEGKWLTGFEFATQHVIPNFYFHATHVYAILRHNGVDLGKKDFLGELPFKH